MMHYSFKTVPEVLIGGGSVRSLGSACERLGVRKPLLITDPGLMKLGVVLPALEVLQHQCDEVLVFDGVQADPSEATLVAAHKVQRQFSADGIVAVGGGSSMDVAKVVAVLAKNRQALAAMYGVDQVIGDRLPLILVPTTAGTGSEATPVAVITTGETTKAGISSALLLPDIAILDAELTLGLPPAITAMTGIDAMVHAIEAFTSKVKKNPVSDGLALQSLALLAANIRKVLADGNDVAAREAMLLGAFFAGQAFANAPVAAVHALAYPLGGHFHLPHGLSNALMLPAVLGYNARVAADHYAKLARVLPQPVSPSAEGLIQWCEMLIADSGLPRTLAAAGIPASALPLLAKEAMSQQRLLVNNPVTVTEADAHRLYQLAWEGRR